jgi:hypothetical protein
MKSRDGIGASPATVTSPDPVRTLSLPASPTTVPGPLSPD